jgi:hypothetical protein
MTYSKATQVIKTLPTKKVCNTCKVNRDLKFFSSKQAHICGDCKRKTWSKKLKESPGKVNKTRDKNWSYTVKELAGNKCEYCGKTEHLNSHHIFSRSNHLLRWDVTNGICLCAGHHVLKSDFSAHKTPADFVEWIKEYRGLEWSDDLRTVA